jgi:voltage-gated potassium channel
LNQHYQQTLAAAAPIFLLYCQPSQLLRLGRPSASKLCRTAFQNGAVEDSRLKIGRLFVFFLRRLWLPVAVFAAFSTLCVLVYMRLEGLRWLDALFWVIHPHSIDYRFVHGATKAFSFFVYVGVFTFQVWIAERVLVTIFNRQGVEAWKSMINDVNIGKLRDHFIICGYGQVGRTVFDQLKRHEIPLVLIETDEGLYRELLKDGVMVIHGDAKRHDILLAAGIERARGICIVIDNDADNLYITVTARSLNPNAKIITRAGQQRYASAIRNSGADEVIIPEYEGGLMTGRMIQKYYPVVKS